MIQYIDSAPLAEPIGRGIDRYERVSAALGQDREALQDGHHHDYFDDDGDADEQALARLEDPA